MAKKPVTVSSRQGASVALDDRRGSVGAWQDRIRDPSLTALLVLELCAVFLASPPAAEGLPIARAVADTLPLAVLVVYLSLATIFASAYGLIWELSPDPFVNLVVPLDGPKEVAIMLYFSLTTLTTTGHGDIVAVDPFARSLANLESVLAQFFLAITVARLVTLELHDRRR